jgi:hypothetical protein
MPIGLPSTVDSKPVFRLENGLDIVDLTSPSMNIISPLLFNGYYLVNDETSMRIDLITQLSMGSLNQSEKMLKMNDISNPFTIDTGDILFIPDLMNANMNMRATADNVRQKQDIRNQYIDPGKASTLDPTLGNYDKREKPKAADPSKTAPALPPNFANVGDKEIEIKGGKIFFGPNVSKNGNECEEPLSKSEFLAKLIKNRINR